MNTESPDIFAIRSQAPETSDDSAQALPISATADGSDEALIELARYLSNCGYRFTVVTPATHARVNARICNAQAQDLRDVFGWNRPYRKNLLPPELQSLLEKAGVLEVDGTWRRSTVRVATLDNLVFLHSAYPTLAADSVFFGPDSYRFARLIREVLAREPARPRTVVDIGCGSGIGGLVAARAIDSTATRIVLADINPKALEYALINAQINGFDAIEFKRSDILDSVSGPIDLIVANPPYLSDPAHRVYRDGGGEHGYELSLRIVRESLQRLAPGGRLVLYTGAAIVGGVDLFKQVLASLPDIAAIEYDYFEIDADVFGEELESPLYADIERIAVVGLIAKKIQRIGRMNMNSGGALERTPVQPRVESTQGLLHRHLARFNRARLRPGFAKTAWRDELEEELELRVLEGSFVEEERQSVRFRLAHAPIEVDAFLEWFERLQETGPGQDDPLFDWLAEQADLPAMSWFLEQEIAGEAGFDDLVALTQVRLPVQAKLELARNYWDEMGRGHENGMHGRMLERTAHDLNLQPAIETTLWESLALANLMTALAANRRYAYQAIGALGVIEMTAPGRVAKINRGLKRLGVSTAARRYFQLHAGLDRQHSEAWNREVIRSLVATDVQVARPIAEGALLRLNCGARCYARYRGELGVLA